MVKLETCTHDTVDVKELAAFTSKVYQSQAQPFRYGDTESDIQSFLSDQHHCPDFLVLAREDGVLVGWAGLYHWTESMSYLLSWHPLVVPFNVQTARRLLRECIRHSESSGRDRMEVFLMSLTDEYRGLASQYKEIYEPAGMKQGYEWKFMEAYLDSPDLKIPQLPRTMRIVPLVEVSNDTLWPSYDAIFMSGGDRRYAEQSPKERRENFEGFFSRKTRYDENASIVLYDNEHIIGFVKIDLISEGAYVHGVGILPEYRKRGLGKFVLGTSMLRAAQGNQKKMILEVDVENVSAIRLYESLGFRQVKGSISYIWQKSEKTSRPKSRA